MEKAQKVTVIGLGVMGATLAGLLLKHHYQTTVWNRTADKIKSLADKGAIAASSVAEAVGASDVIVICVSDYEAVNNLINQPQLTAAVSGKVIVNLTTGIPSEATRMNDFMGQCKATYLDGAILSFADQMGKEDTTILLSGSEQAFQQLQRLLSAFGGNVKYLGTKPGAASALDQTVLSYMYGALTGFFHGVLIAQKEGLDIGLVGEFLDNATPGMGHFVKHEAEQIQTRQFEVTLSSVATNLQAVQNIYNTSKYYGLDLRFPELVLGYFSDAERLGLGGKELASLIDVFNKQVTAC